MATVALSGIITPTNVVTAASTTTLTNKTISGASNTLSNIPLSTAVTGTLPIANGGTGTTSTTFVNAATNVTGTLPIANGGTGTTSTTFVNAATNVTGTLPVANGGTGQTALSAVTVGTSTNLAGGSNGTIPYQTASGATAMLAVGTSGQVLQTNGAGAPTWVTVVSGLSAATQAEMEAASSNTVSATPANTKYHPGVAKLWLKVGALFNANTIMASYNVTSTTEGTGTLTVTIATDFSSGEYVVVATPQYSQPNNAYDKITLGVSRGNMAAGSFALCSVNYTNVLTDPDYYLCAAFGDQ